MSTARNAGVSRGVNNEIRRSVFKRFGGRCAACGRRLRFSKMQCDHIRARSEGGSDDIRNLQSLCEDCHKFRHGWDGRISYSRLLKCGCRVSVIRRRILPSHRVLRHLKIKPFRPLISPEIVICCVRHSRMSVAEWRRLGPIRFHPKLPAISRARLQRFIVAVL
jgi:HNH endonuclease